MTISPEQIQNRIILWYPIGWTGSDRSLRYVRAIDPIGGWTKFANEKILPAIDWAVADGIKPRIQLHNPFGVSGSPMPAGAWIEAQEENLHWLTDDFIPLMKNFVQSGVEIIAYLGTPGIDPNFKEELTLGRMDNWLMRLWRSYRPALEAGCSIAIDAASWSKLGELGFYAAKTIESLINESNTPAKCYVEATPRRDRPWWYSSNKQILEKSYQERHISTKPNYWARFAQFQPASKVFAELTPDGSVTQNDVYQGEFCRIAKGIDQGYETPEGVRTILQDGHTAIIPARLCVGKISAKKLLGKNL